jgi:hypothetical protein
MGAVTDPPIKIDFGDDELWHDSLKQDQLGLFDEPPLTLPLQLTPPTAPPARPVEDVETREDLL